jgi:hypothetical protein
MSEIRRRVLLASVEADFSELCRRILTTFRLVFENFRLIPRLRSRRRFHSISAGPLEDVEDVAVAVF